MELSGPLIWSTYSYELVLTISIRGLPDSAVLSSWTAEAAGFEAGCHNLKAAGLWGVGRKRMVHGDPWPYVECMYIYMCIYGLVWNVDCFHGTTDIYVDSVPNLIGIYGDIRRCIHI